MDPQRNIHTPRGDADVNRGYAFPRNLRGVGAFRIGPGPSPEPVRPFPREGVPENWRFQGRGGASLSIAEESAAFAGASAWQRGTSEKRNKEDERREIGREGSAPEDGGGERWSVPRRRGRGGFGGDRRG